MVATGGGGAVAVGVPSVGNGVIGGGVVVVVTATGGGVAVSTGAGVAATAGGIGGRVGGRGAGPVGESVLFVPRAPPSPPTFPRAGDGASAAATTTIANANE